MAKLDPKLIKIFANNSGDNGTTVFGSTKDSNTQFSKDPDILQNSNYLEGWKGASYTQLNIQITTDRACYINKGFIISDNVGNNFVLLNDFNCSSPGTYIALFQSAIAGKVSVGLNTVINIITPTLGITAVINDSAPVNIGADEESDLELRTRFNSSVALNGKSGADNLYSALLNVAGAVSCYVDNNRTNEINQYGTPPHSIWTIVNGGTDEDIGNAIYGTISDGCGMRGETEVYVEDEQGNLQNVFFDRVSFENLYIKFIVYGKTPSVVIDTEKIKEDLVNNLKINTNMLIDKNYVNTTLTSDNSNIIYSEIKLSKDNENWLDMVQNTNLNYQFILNTDNITITVE
jgi:uncharacterized phage protein gp47/JayE